MQVDGEISPTFRPSLYLCPLPRDSEAPSFKRGHLLSFPLNLSLSCVLLRSTEQSGSDGVLVLSLGLKTLFLLPLS